MKGGAQGECLPLARVESEPLIKDVLAVDDIAPRRGGGSAPDRLDYDAPFCRLLWIVSGLSTALLVSLPVIGWVALPPQGYGFARLLMVVTPLTILIGAVPFMVRGYRIEPGRLAIRRLGWSSRLSLQELQSAKASPLAMKGSLRLMGNGGLFVFAGWFWSRTLGRYRAFVTDPARCVVLRFQDRTVVVSPDSPDEFARTLTGIVHSRGGSLETNHRPARP